MSKNKFVMVGLKEKGKIVKNEMMTIDKFQKNIMNTYTIAPEILLRRPNFFERLFPKKYLRNITSIVNELIKHSQIIAKLAVIDYIDEVIDNDKRGKRK